MLLRPLEYVYVQGENAACDWLRARNSGTDVTFETTLKALLHVPAHDDRALARDSAVSPTGRAEYGFSPNAPAYDSTGSVERAIESCVVIRRREYR